MPRHLAPALICALTFATQAPADEVVVFAAASLKTALDALAADFETSTGHRVTISYAGSNALARQIIDGAPADIFLSAAVAWMDEVEAEGLLAPGTRRDLFGNRLVLIAHGKDQNPVSLTPALDLASLLGDGKLSMALVDAVPAGQYGKEALTTLGLWPSVAAQVAQSENVRAALTLVATGEAPLGVVYATDVARSDDVTVIATFPAESHQPITYPGALLTHATDAADRAFFAALSSDPGDATFAALGFAILN